MDNDMNSRLTILETRIETILPTLATKSDLLEVKTSIVMWVVLVTLSVAALNMAVMVFIFQRLPVQPAQPPQVIVVPQSQPAPTVPQK